MKRQNVRVILASEHPQALDLLREVVEKEEGIVVGEAENAAKAVSLTKTLRPDVAIIDSYLPYVVGLDDVPLSRVGGLDTAQTIVERTPDTRVVLLNNLDPERLSQRHTADAGSTVFAREQMDETVPFTLRDLHQQEWSDNGVVFANLGESSQAPQVEATATNIIFGGMLVGGLALVAGWMLVIALWLVPAGIYLAAGGAAVLALSFAARFLHRKRPSFFRRPGGTRDNTEVSGS
jgi:CheY-like chemotaxis protein